MTNLHRKLLGAVMGPTLALLVSCGGGGGSGSAPAPTWVQGQFSPEANFAALCVAPRTGTDPATQKPYADRQGTLLNELNWLRSWTNDLYLWYGEVLDKDPATFTTDAAYFAVLKTTAKTASGSDKDKFHFTYATTTWQALEQSGVQAGYGVDFVVLSSTPPRSVVVGYTEPNIPANNKAENVLRGAKILTIDGADLVNATDQTSIDTLNAGLSPKTVNETHTFTIMDAGATASRTVTLISADVTVTPVQNAHSITMSGGALVGYMLFNDHLATAEKALVDAFTTLQADGVTDLVLDIRYNGGGLLDIASEVAYMVAGPTPTAGQTFELTRFNDKHPSVNPVSGSTITPVPFHSTTQGFSSPAGQSLPTLGLSRVFVLTGPSTCSASESIINSLRGVNVQVIQIGSTTCGKPYGFYPTDNCGTTYFSIQFQGVNAMGFGDYTDGFQPSNAVTKVGVQLPGCSVADDFGHQLGDSAEGLLAAALGYQSTPGGVCPVPATGSLAPPPALAAAYVPPRADGQVVKSLWQRNRIQQRVDAR